MFHPVHAKFGDQESEVVALSAISLAWDAALRNLLPSDVEGIHVVGKNNCGQSFTYEIVGRDAFFRGDADLHEPEFDGRGFYVSLDFHEHGDFFKMPGHCAYSLVRRTLRLTMRAISNPSSVGDLSQPEVSIRVCLFHADYFCLRGSRHLSSHDCNILCLRLAGTAS